jgi:hypothetical protein
LPPRESEDRDWDYVRLARVQVGSVSAQGFVDLLLFDERGECGIEGVVEAFKAAAWLDGVGEGRVRGVGVER